MAALSEMDSFRLESLPRCIFNVLTYSFHGPGFMEAPPYRLPGKGLPTAPTIFPNGKVTSCGQDTQESSSAEGLTATAVPAFLQETLSTTRKMGTENTPPPQKRCASGGVLGAPLLTPGVLPDLARRACLAQLEGGCPTVQQRQLWPQ